MVRQSPIIRIILLFVFNSSATYEIRQSDNQGRTTTRYSLGGKAIRCGLWKNKFFGDKATLSQHCEHNRTFVWDDGNICK